MPIVDDLRAARAEKIAVARAGRQEMQAKVAAAAPEQEDKPATPIAPVVEPKDPAKPAVKAAEKPAEKPVEEPVADAKGLAAIERREARAREQIAAEKAAWKQERDLELAELKKLRDDVHGKVTSLDDLKKLAKSKPIEALRALGIESEDDLEVVARQTYAVSKSGKADPKNKAYADQLAEKRGTASDIDGVRKELSELKEQLATRERQAEAKQHAERWIDEGVKAIPTNPSFLGKAHAANPTKARADLLATGQQMLREAIEENGGRYSADLEPAHADVIARYEANKRQTLKDDGFTDEQIAAMLTPAAAAGAKAPKGPPPKTLDVAGGRPTQDPTPQSRKEKIALASAGLRKLWSEGT